MANPSSAISISIINKLIINKIPTFMENIQLLLKTRYSIDISKLKVDHICYRCNTKNEYVNMKEHLNNYGATLLIESMINGRPISTFKFVHSIEYNNGTIPLLELPCPSSNNKYKTGLQHIEVVLPASNTDQQQHMHPFLDNTSLDEFIRRNPLSKNLYGSMTYNKKAINSDVEIVFSDEEEECLFDQMSVKFHASSLENVIKYEIENDMVKHVPDDYFDDCKL